MQLTTILLSLAATVYATPAPAAPSLAEMQSAFASSELCQLPTPKPSCSGASRSDIIVLYNSDSSAASQSLLLDAARAAGGDIVYEWKGFGFSGFVPDGVVALLRAHSEVTRVTIYENACVRIPDCGDGPC
ncbi:Nn.00g031010.m01.CDS01 [Neocucurbitaria sp. VM-36]